MAMGRASSTRVLCQAIAFFDSEPITYSSDNEIPINTAVKTIINVGSAGQPRDGDLRAACAVYDSEENRATICRLDYDIDGAVDKIRKEGLPELLADRLKLGK